MSKNNSQLNVFKYGYWSWRCPFKNIQQFFRNIKYAWQRATKGYCDFDVWNLDGFYGQLFTDSLRELADTTHGSPAEITPEEWDKILREMADAFEIAMQDEDPIEGEAFYKLYKQFEIIKRHEDGSISHQLPEDNPELNKAREEYLNALIVLQKYRDNMKDKGFDMMKKWFRHLWD